MNANASVTLTDDRGWEILGTRLTIWNLVDQFLDPFWTEDRLARLYSITPEQVAKARVYFLSNYDAVMKRHWEIETRNTEGNPPELRAQLEDSNRQFALYRQFVKEGMQNGSVSSYSWMDNRERFERWMQSHPAIEPPVPDNSFQVPTFKEWFLEQENRIDARGAAA